MSTHYVLIVLSFLCGLALIKHLRTHDIYEKEPFLTMAAVMIWGGLCAVIFSVILYTFVQKLGITKFDNILGALLIIGPIEEGAKFLALLSSYWIFKRDFDEPTDGVIYMSCVAGGFSLIENFFYATQAPESGYLLFLRLFISTPLHIFASLLMGLALYVFINMDARQRKIFNLGPRLFVVTYVYAVFLHGLFDGLIFHGWLAIFLFIVLRKANNRALCVLSYTTAKSSFRITLKEFIETYQNPLKHRGLECVKCGNVHAKDTYILGKIRLQRCEQCGSFVTSIQSLYALFHHFGADFRNLTHHYSQSHIGPKRYGTIFQGNYISEDKQLAFFTLEELNTALLEFRAQLIHELEKKLWWYVDDRTIT
jgi:RsiW-degrading membrane proteinase PrsW (M82 family)